MQPLGLVASRDGEDLVVQTMPWTLFPSVCTYVDRVLSV